MKAYKLCPEIHFLQAILFNMLKNNFKLSDPVW